MLLCSQPDMVHPCALRKDPRVSTARYKRNRTSNFLAQVVCPDIAFGLQEIANPPHSQHNIIHNLRHEIKGLFG